MFLNEHLIQLANNWAPDSNNREYRNYINWIFKSIYTAGLADRSKHYCYWGKQSSFYWQNFCAALLQDIHCACLIHAHSRQTHSYLFQLEIINWMTITQQIQSFQHILNLFSEATVVQVWFMIYDITCLLGHLLCYNTVSLIIMSIGYFKWPQTECQTNSLAIKPICQFLICITGDYFHRCITWFSHVSNFLHIFLINQG